MEKDVVGAFIMNPELHEKLECSKKLFESEYCWLIYKETKKAYKDNREIDTAILSEILDRKVPASYICSVLDGFPKSQATFEVVDEKIRRLKSKRIAGEVIQEAKKESISILKGMEPSLTKIRERFKELDNLNDDRKLLEIETLKSLYSSEIPKREVLANPVIGKKEIIVISGLPKSGKSILSLNLAFCLAKGKDWLNFTINKPIKVLIFQQEISRESYKERISIMHPAEKDLEFLENISINKERGLTIDTNQGLQAISKAIESFRPEFIIIDPLTSFHTKKENVAEEMGALFKTFQSLVDKYETAIFIIHHFSKVDPEERHGIYMARGSGVISAYPDAVWILKYLSRNKFDLEEDDFLRTVELSFELRNANPIRPLILKRNDRLWYELIEVSKKGKLDVDDIIEEIKNAGGTIYQSRLEQKFKGRASHRTFLKAVQEAEKLEIIDSSIIEGSRGNSKMIFLRGAA